MHIPNSKQSLHHHRCPFDDRYFGGVADGKNVCGVSCVCVCGVQETRERLFGLFGRLDGSYLLDELAMAMCEFGAAVIRLPEDSV